MPPIIATVLFVIGILGLFWLDRDGEARTSKALWIPVVYLFLIGSRSVSAWLGIAPTESMSTAYMEGNPVDRAVLLAFLAVGLTVLITRRGRVGTLVQKNWPILLFFAYAALSILWSDFPYVTFKHWVKGIEDVVIVLVVLTEANPAIGVRRLLTRAGFVMIPLSVLLSRYYPNLGRMLDTQSWTIQSVGVATQKNQLGTICLIFGLGSLWCFLSAYRDREDAARGRRMVAHGAMLGMVILLLQMCDSMTSIVCFVLAGLLMLLISRSAAAGKRARVHLLVAAAACVALFPLFVAPSLVQTVGRDTTFSGRTDIWHGLLSLDHHPVVGVGYNSFFLGPRLSEIWSIDNGELYHLQEAHNGYLQVYLELGWIGVSLLALLFITGYRKVVTAFRQDPFAGSLGLALFVATLIHGLTEADFAPQWPLWFSLLLAIVGASQILSKEAEVSVPTRSGVNPERRIRQAVAAGAAAQAAALARCR